MVNLGQRGVRLCTEESAGHWMGSGDLTVLASMALIVGVAASAVIMWDERVT